MELSEIVVLAMRWLHIMAATAAVGGTIFMRLALLPSVSVLSPEAHQQLHGEVRRRWSKVVMAAIGFLLLSGFYNFLMVILPSLRDTLKEISPRYNMIFGIKFLIALAMFFIASALVGRSAAFAAIRKNARMWLTVNLVLAMILIGLSSYLRFSRDQVYRQKIQQNSAAIDRNPT